MRPDFAPSTRQLTGAPHVHHAYVLDRNGRVVKSCSHRHRSVAAANVCAARMTRSHAKAAFEPRAMSDPPATLESYAMGKTKEKRQGFAGGCTRGLPSQDSLRDLLYAAYNIGPTIASDEAGGQAAIQAANSTVGAIFALVDTSVRIAVTPEEKRGVVDGVVTAIRLLAETTCAKDPEEYAVSEARRANDGARHEDYGATIELPSQVHGA